MATDKKNPPEFPADRYKTWKYDLHTCWEPAVFVRGSAQEVKKQISRLSLWDEVKTSVEDIKAEAKKAKVQGLEFEVSSSSNYDGTFLVVRATGFREKTEKERLAGETARERNREKREARERKQAEADKKKLQELMAKYPDLAKEARRA